MCPTHCSVEVRTGRKSRLKPRGERRNWLKFKGRGNGLICNSPVSNCPGGRRRSERSAREPWTDAAADDRYGVFGTLRLKPVSKTRLGRVIRTVRGHETDSSEMQTWRQPRRCARVRQVPVRHAQEKPLRWPPPSSSGPGSECGPDVIRNHVIYTIALTLRRLRRLTAYDRFFSTVPYIVVHVRYRTDILCVCIYLPYFHPSRGYDHGRPLIQF